MVGRLFFYALTGGRGRWLHHHDGLVGGASQGRVGLAGVEIGLFIVGDWGQVGLGLGGRQSEQSHPNIALR